MRIERREAEKPRWRALVLVSGEYYVDMRTKKAWCYRAWYEAGSPMTEEVCPDGGQARDDDTN